MKNINYTELDLILNNSHVSKYLTVRKGMNTREVLCKAFNFSVNAIVVFRDDEEELDEFFGNNILDKMISSDGVEAGYILAGTIRINKDKLVLVL